MTLVGFRLLLAEACIRFNITADRLVLVAMVAAKVAFAILQAPTARGLCLDGRFFARVLRR